MKGFCERKFGSMFISGTFTKAVMYIMLLCDSIIAGYFKGLSGYILSGLMESHKEKAYLVTTGYNRNMIRFSKNEKWQRRGNDECI